MDLSEHPTQVFLLIENRLVRETLVRLFRKRSDISVVGQGSLTEALRLRDTNCGIVVLDDLEAACSLAANCRAGGPTANSVGMVLIGMEEDAATFFAAVRSGVMAYLLNDASASDVVAAVRAAARGEAVCPPRLCLNLFRFVARTAQEPSPEFTLGSMTGLTLRQQQLMTLVAKGLTNKEIAAQLNLSEFTIKNHMHRIMKQVEAGSRQEAVEALRASSYMG